MTVNAKLVTRRKEAQAVTLSRMARSQAGDCGALPKVGAKKARTPKKEWKWHRRIVAHPLSESQWNRGLFQFEKVGVREARKLVHTNGRFQGPLMAPCWAPLENGVHAVGRWCN